MAFLRDKPRTRIHLSVRWMESWANSESLRSRSVWLLSLALADRINAMRDLHARTLQETGQKLAAMNQQLARTNQLKDEFLSTVTHELRTPMNAVWSAWLSAGKAPTRTTLQAQLARQIGRASCRERV